MRFKLSARWRRFWWNAKWKSSFHLCGAGGPQLKRNPLGSPSHIHKWQVLSMEVVAGLFAALVVIILTRIGLLPGRDPGLYQVMARSERLRKTDPTQADRVLEDYVQGQAAADDQECNELRRRAIYNLQAAKRLLTHLRRRAKALARMRRHVRFTVQEGEHAFILRHLEHAQREALAEIERLKEPIQRLHG